MNAGWQRERKRERLTEPDPTAPYLTSFESSREETSRRNRPGAVHRPKMLSWSDIIAAFHGPRTERAPGPYVRHEVKRIKPRVYDTRDTQVHACIHVEHTSREGGKGKQGENMYTRGRGERKEEKKGKQKGQEKRSKEKEERRS